MWRAKSLSVVIPESDKQKEESVGAKTVMIGTEILKLKEPIVVDNSITSNNDVVAVP